MLSMARKLGQIVSGFRSSVLSALARFAVHTLREPNTAAKVVAVRRSDVKKDAPLVFDLTVEKHRCYLANGLLVSNSDAFLNLAVGLKKTGSGLPQGVAGGDDGLDGLGGGDDDGPLTTPYELDEDF